jgi:D-alanine-D-alanine ligase
MKKILILHNTTDNTRIDEADTLIQVSEISRALKELNYIVDIGTIGNSLSDIEKLITYHRPHLVFNIVESFCGSDKNQYLIPAYLETLGITYTGCPSSALFLTGNKIIAKKIMLGSNILTPAYFDEKSFSGDINESTKLIVKSQTEHASFAMDANSIVIGKTAAWNLMKQKKELHGGEWMAEQYIDGREINVSVMGKQSEPQILPIPELVFKDFPEGVPKIFDYPTKWEPQSHGYINTYRIFIDEKAEYILSDKIKDVILQCWNSFKIEGYARVDFRVDEQGNPWVLEINTNPCLTSDGGFIAASEKLGLSYNQTINHIMEITNHESIVDIKKTAIF